MAVSFHVSKLVSVQGRMQEQLVKKCSNVIEALCAVRDDDCPTIRRVNVRDQTTATWLHSGGAWWRMAEGCTEVLRKEVPHNAF